ncbi:MAG: hypothetical protein MUP19_09535, partial [Candidatus Aminicenantes bacterium]|nr:hypothetical protein [Candidatus Aminicenantes bacterium]
SLSSAAPLRSSHPMDSMLKILIRISFSAESVCGRGVGSVVPSSHREGVYERDQEASRRV